MFVKKCKHTLKKIGIKPDGIVTFREEYIIAKTLLAKEYSSKKQRP